MFEMIASVPGFITILALFGVGAIGSLLLRKQDELANWWANGFAILGSLWGMLFASAVLITGQTISGGITLAGLPLVSLSFRIDLLAAFFVFVISLITLFCSVYGIGYVRQYYKQYSIGSLGLFYNLFIAGMLAVVTASNGIFFLMAWEVMSLASYCLVVYDRKDIQNVKAGYLYLIMTHVGALCILAAFLTLFAYTNSFDLAIIKQNILLVPETVRVFVALLAFVGLGIKAGVIPLHIWLPSAHPAAPSHVSGLMSGVMIKTGIYMIIRLLLDVLQPLPVWVGLVVLIIGAISTLLGVLYALTEHDLKRLLAYHSIENIGIILLGVGGALAFLALNLPAWALVALTAALFHTLNHAVFKSLLFLSAGSVIHAMHTRNIEKYGGLIKYMPLTALAFLVGSVAITALPPFNGFFSEWLTFQAMFKGISMLGDARWAFLFAGVILAVTGGLALACFVKVFGATFLARPRSEAVKKAHESSAPMLISMAGLSILCLLIGLASGPISSVLQTVSHQLAALSDSPSVVGVSPSAGLALGQPVALVSGVAVSTMLIAITVVVWLVVRYGVYKKQKVVVGSTWDCGTPLNGRMEITATGFSWSIIQIARGLLKPSLQHSVEYDDATSRYSVVSRTISIGIVDVYKKYFYGPLYSGLIAVSRQTKRIQNANINMYILYIFVALVITLVVAEV